jgi:chloramphenicol 3-O phosphotransferase
MSKIIFLNGCSSAGKSLIVRAIQHLSDEFWLNFGFDTFFNAMLSKYLPFGEKAHEGIQFITPKNEEEKTQTTEVKSGRYGEGLAKSIPKIFKLLADDGHYLILDEVVWEEEEMKDYSLILKNHEVYFVKVACKLELVEEREKIRGDRVWGLARDQYNKIENLKWEYDVNVDTSQLTPFESAKKILEAVEKKQPQTFA